MGQIKTSKRFFFISFFPALAYWYLEANFSLRVALVGGIGLACLEVLLEKILFRRIHIISQINFILLVTLGGVAFWGEDGIWFKLGPCFTGAGFGGLLFIQNMRGKSIMWKMAQEFQNRLAPRFLVETMEKHISLFMVLYGIFMGGVAILCSTDEWVFFRTAGFYLTFLIFAVGEILFLRKKVTIYSNSKK